MKKNEYSIVVIENSQLGREVLVNSLNTFENIQVELEVDEVETCIALLAGGARFDAVVFVLDLFSGNWINQIEKLKGKCPNLPIVALTDILSELITIRLLKAGVNSILHRESSLPELKQAVETVINEGLYFPNHYLRRFMTILRSLQKGEKRMDITDQQIEFLKLACTDATYKEIADRMKLTVRSVDSIRDTLFLRLEVRSRVGLAVMAIKNGLVQLSCD